MHDFGYMDVFPRIVPFVRVDCKTAYISTRGHQFPLLLYVTLTQTEASLILTLTFPVHRDEVVWLRGVRKIVAS